MLLASASRTVNSRSPDLTSMSSMPDATIRQVVPPARTDIERSFAFNVTRCILPAMTQFSPSCVTSTSGAPQSARESTCVVVGRGGGGVVIDDVRTAGCDVGTRCSGDDELFGEHETNRAAD